MTLRNPPAFVQSGGQGADTVRRMMASLLSSPGIVAPTDLLVSQHAGTPAMSVDVAGGGAWVLGTAQADQGWYHAWSDGVVTLAVAASNPTNPRRDLVVLSMQDAAYSGVESQAILSVITGNTTDPTPLDPVVPANSLVLARLTIPANKGSVLSGDITDLRVRSALAVPPVVSIPPSVKASGSRSDGWGITGAEPRGVDASMTGVPFVIGPSGRVRVAMSAHGHCSGSGDLFLSVLIGATVYQVGCYAFTESNVDQLIVVETVIGGLTPGASAFSYQLGISPGCTFGTVQGRGGQTLSMWILVTPE